VPRALAASRALACAAALACASACAPNAPPRALHELERLAFVAPGEAPLPSFGTGDPRGRVERPLLVDLFETTWADWAHYDARAFRARRIELRLPPQVSEGGDLPASLSLVEARALCAQRGMRVPSAAEWIYCAVGPAALRFPWGAAPQRSLANTLELGLGRALAVGSFEGGRSPFGCYDMLGNAWEWVEGWVPGIDLAPVAPVASDAAGEAGEAANELSFSSALGGSWLFRTREIHAAPRVAGAIRPTVYALSYDPRSIAGDLGVRAVADAREYLRARASAWGRGEDVERRVRAVGQRFGSSALPYLEAWSAEPDAPRALRWLAEGARP
jgi:hypothetical protein